MSRANLFCSDRPTKMNPQKLLTGIKTLVKGMLGVFCWLTLGAIPSFADKQEQQRKAGKVALEKMRQHLEQARLLTRYLDVKDWDAFDAALAAAKFDISEHEQWLARKAQAI